MQMDDWWYIGDHPGQNWGGVKAVSHWDPPAPWYPNGLKGLYETLNIPLLLYGPYFSPNNDWTGQFTFIPQNAKYNLPSPSDSYNFYSTVFDYGLDGRGMMAYEVDFMSCLSGTPLFRTHVEAGRLWLKGMNDAAKKRGLGIQVC